MINRFESTAAAAPANGHAVCQAQAPSGTAPSPNASDDARAADVRANPFERLRCVAEVFGLEEAFAGLCDALRVDRNFVVELVNAVPTPPVGTSQAPVPGAACRSSASRELALRVQDFREYPSEFIDQAVLGGRTIVIHAANPDDPFGAEELPAQTGKPVAVLLPIAEYRRLCGISHALIEILSDFTQAQSRALTKAECAIVGRG